MEPGFIGSVRTKNRILKTGANPGFFPYKDGYVQENYIHYYETLARGGAGIVTLGAAEIDYPMALMPDAGYRLDDDKYIPSFDHVVRAIQKYGCPAFIQMFHTGPMHPSRLSGIQPVAASSLSKAEMPKPQFEIARALTVSEIEDIIQKFGKAAERAKQAGFQGIELNGGCAHLLNSFISRAWNKRDDSYGSGSLESRTKIMTDIIREIKRRNGKDFAIIALINGVEPGLENGITIEESCRIGKLLEAAGADAIHVRVEFYSRPKNPADRESTHFPDVAFYPEVPYPVGGTVDTSHHGVGGWVPPAIAIKKSVSIPVIAVGRLGLDIGEKLLRRGYVDFISLNRRLMADPELPNKIAAGRLDEIAPCTACLTCYDAVEHFSLPPVCRINAALGREKEYQIVTASVKKTVLVVGGGPAGMEAARVAALRGHHVILYEKENRLGGSLNLASIVKGFDREDLISIVSYFRIQLKKLGVDVRLKKKFDWSMVKNDEPDVIIIASGGSHDIPQIPGIKTRKVLTSKDLHSSLRWYLRFFSPRFLHWLTNIWLPVGKTVVVIGGNIQGCQVAEFLIKRGKKVTIVESSEKIGEGLLEILVKPHLLQWLEEKAEAIITCAELKEVTEAGLVIGYGDSQSKTIPADTIVTALPLLAGSRLFDRLKEIVPEIYAIGDCKEPKLIVDAISDGSSIARII